MTAEITALVIWIIGLALYILSCLPALKCPWARPIGLIMFGVGLFLWAGTGSHVASLR